MELPWDHLPRNPLLLERKNRYIAPVPGRCEKHTALSTRERNHMNNGLPAFCLVAAAVASVADTLTDFEHILLKGDAAEVVIAVDGGAIADFHLGDDGLNPLGWTEEGEAAQSPPWRGHFLCLDRWGEPSAAEAANGMPFHGEASRLRWRVTSEPMVAGGFVTAEMAVDLPLAGLAVKRSIALSKGKAFFHRQRGSHQRQPTGAGVRRSSASDHRPRPFWTKPRSSTPTVARGS